VNPSTTIPVINPATEEAFDTVSRGAVHHVADAVDAAFRSQKLWDEMAPSERGKILTAVAGLLDDQIDEVARLTTLEVGKPISEARSDVATASAYFRYYGGAADKVEGETIPVGPGHLVLNMLEPIGVTGHIVPWNYPISLAARSVAPALATGNAAIIKPSEEAPLSVRRLRELCLAAGVPDGVVAVVTGYGAEAGAALVAHPRVGSITFTGSVETGRTVATACARTFKRCVTELGGKSPQIVLGDADMPRAVAHTVRGLFTNAGQTCSASSRILVHRDVASEYAERLAEAASQLRIGPGLEDPQLGPLISAAHLARVSGFIDRGVAEGARLLSGGSRPSSLDKGYFIEPTVFDRVHHSMSLAQEEIFGPVAAITSFDDEDDIASLANDVRYGLVAGIYTQDVARAIGLARKLEAGQVWINDWFVGGVQAPMGGYKESGQGREKGLRGLENYVNVKNIGVALPSES